jgi:hypothetical protein
MDLVDHHHAMVMAFRHDRARSGCELLSPRPSVSDMQNGGRSVGSVSLRDGVGFVVGVLPSLSVTGRYPWTGASPNGPTGRPKDD